MNNEINKALDKIIDKQFLNSTGKCKVPKCELEPESLLANHCILHSKNIDKDVLSFNQALKKYISKNGFEYSNICFPTKYKVKFKTTNKVKFTNCIFYNEFDISGSEFLNDVNFDNCTFHKSVFCSRVNFNKHVTMRGCDFNNTLSLNKSSFNGGCFFYFNQFYYGADFRDVIFEGKSRIVECYIGYSVFHMADIKNLRFDDCIWEKGHILSKEKYSYKPIETSIGKFWLTDKFSHILMYKIVNLFKLSDKNIVRVCKFFFNKEYKKQCNLQKNGGNIYGWDSTSYNEFLVESTYRTLKLKFKEQGEYDIAGKFAIRENIVKRKQKPLLIRWLLYWIYELFLGYGENHLKILINAGLAILFYSIIYYFSKGIMFEDNQSIDTIIESIYFSAVTFTTLGYGDYHPIGIFRLVASSEALIGAFLIAFYVVSLSRKFIR